MAPAGLRKRVPAFAIDYLAISAYLLALTGVAVGLGYVAPDVIEAAFGDRVIAQATGFLLVTLPVTLYFAVQELSRWRATWGKRVMGVRVVAPGHDRVTFPRALARTLLKFVPWELAHTFVWQSYFSPDGPSSIVIAGFAVVWALVGVYLLSIILSEDKRAVYDRLAGTAVVRVDRTDARTPSGASVALRER